MGQVETSMNTIIASGEFGFNELRFTLSAVHKLTEKMGYKSLDLDFSNLRKVNAPDILPLCAHVRGKLHEGVDTTLTLPEEPKLKRLFEKTNWAYILDPRSFSKSERDSNVHLPAMIYKNGEEQHQAVERILEILLKSLKDVTRAQLSALEWSVNEITDNVLNHSDSDIGVIVQATSRKKGEIVEFVVCDSGRGIPTTLKETHQISSDSEALDRAIREGITRNKNTNMGNGLYGSYRTAQVSEGAFIIYSGYASLKF